MAKDQAPQVVVTNSTGEPIAFARIYDNERKGTMWFKKHMGFHGDKHRPTAQSIRDALNEGRLKPLPLILG